MKMVFEQNLAIMQLMQTVQSGILYFHVILKALNNLVTNDKSWAKFSYRHERYKLSQTSLLLHGHCDRS